MSWSDLTVTLNSDGSPVFKSSKGSLWPIQVALNELPVPHRWKNILVGAVWFAKEHPPCHLFLKTFVDKFNAIGTLVWTFAGRTVRSTVSALCCCVDSPARAALLNAKQYNGYYGCSWCFQKGTLIDGTLKYIFEGPDAMERCHDSVISAMSIAASRGCPADGIKGPSAVANLRTLDLVWGFPPDYLHCILEGVVCQLMELWLSSTGKPWYIGNRIRILNDRMMKIRPPGFFTRLPRSLSERSFWKASELKYWLLYYGAPCLENILPHKYLLHFSLLSHSTYLLLKASIKEWEISHADLLLQQFVQEMPKLYGDNTFTFNVHQLVHIAKSVRMTGPLWATSTFPFEGGNGDLLKLVSAAKGVPQQIAERCIMQEMLKSLKRIVFLPPMLKKKQQIISGKKTVNHYASAVMGAPLPASNLESSVHSLLNALGPVSTIGEYFRAQIRGIIVHSSHYKRAEKSCSQYIETCDGRLCRIVNVLSVDSSMVFVCQELMFTESLMPFLYEVEHPPPDVGLCLLQEESIFSLCVYVERNDKSFIVKIPNLYERD
ncbi:uncharacterized protein LOC125941843 [Dermacentor silvarum]|uniref:uncharacterized protein LOC125941843 n=1 Tax=Dermacentor silvarum TaxID=543639 RepID=UPI00210180F9|nr:uncharacterized protein LOC125941843 [Dermacentor silvarum]